MADVGNKRKVTRALEESTKRLRIEPLSSSVEDLAETYQENSGEDSNNDFEDDSDDVQSQNADTPLTPFSPSRKFPSDLKTIRCTYEGCTKSFNRPARLTAHLRSHSNERPFACSYAGCDKTYIEEKHLRQHIKGSHTHEKSYQCNWDGCSKSFLTATRLRRHLETHEGHDRFRCTAYPPCNQTFRKHQTLQRHIRAEHLEIAPFPCTYVDPATKAACNAGFDSGGGLRKHEDRVHGALRFWCDECCTSQTNHDDDVSQQVGFRTKNELTRHIRTEHSNCIFCDLKCSSQAELQRHIETQHSNSDIAKPSTNLSERKTIACTFPDCSKTFTKKYNLGVHIRSAHDGQRFICSTTSITFKSPELAFWTGINACGKDFISKANLEDHIRTQHLSLPSLVNAKRPKGHSSGKKKGKKSKTEDNDLDAIKLLTGAGYGQDPIRNIPCLIPDCPWLFTRQYDLNLHLQSAHNLSKSEISAHMTGLDSALGPYDPNNRTSLEEMYDQADLGWDIQRTAAADGENAPFWIGAGDEEDLGAADAWNQEEEEMRRLCDQEGDLDRFVDPALRGI